MFLVFYKIFFNYCVKRKDAICMRWNCKFLVSETFAVKLQSCDANLNRAGMVKD